MHDEKRKQGRPKNGTIIAIQHDAVSVELPRHVPPIICPGCGRGMQPRVLRWLDGVAHCSCALCGAALRYRPGKVTIIKNV